MRQTTYRWVQVINTLTRSGAIIQSIQTHDSEDKYYMFDNLLLKHRAHIYRHFPDFDDRDVVDQWVIFMDADTKMSAEKISLDYL